MRVGLDITAYRNLRALPHDLQLQINNSDDRHDTACQHNAFIPYDHPNFPGRIGRLSNKTAYWFDRTRVEFGLSYGYYDRFRTELARMVGIASLERWWACPVVPASMPFGEMLAFSDCEGTLGPEVCHRIALDFIRWGFASTRRDHDFSQTYDKFRVAFEHAAQDGCVDYH